MIIGFPKNTKKKNLAQRFACSFDYICSDIYCDTMNKFLYPIAILLSTCFLMPSCNMRPKDAERLKAEIEEGNRKSMEVYVVNASKELITPEESKQYLDILSQEGNFMALTVKFTDECYEKGKTEANQWEPVYIRWMEKGAKKGTPDCMYKLGMTYLEKDHPDSTKAVEWLTQAADSCQASANVVLRRIAGKETVLDRPRFAFRQMWRYTARDQSFLNRASNATFHFLAECLRSSFSPRNLFGPNWWQCLLLIALMFGVLILGIVYAITRSGSESISALASGVYGWLNGFALFFFAKGKSSISGILTSCDAIGQFTQQPATYGLISDLCRWGTWVWALIIVAVYLRGLYGFITHRRLTVATFLTYTLKTLFAVVFFYLLAGAVSALSWFVGICVYIALFWIWPASHMTDEDWKKLDEKTAKQAEEAEKRRQEAERKKRQKEEEENAQRIRENSKRYL